MDELLSRVYSAYFKVAKRDGYEAEHPSEGRSGAEDHGGKAYVVLRNDAGVLAVYRVRNDGMLKRLRQWPSDLGYTANGSRWDPGLPRTRRFTPSPSS